MPEKRPAGHPESAVDAAVVRVVSAWENSTHTLDFLLDRELGKSRLDPGRKAQVTERSANWARGQGAVRWLLSQVLSRSPESLPPPLRRLLEVTVARLLFEERTPRALIVSQAVDQVKAEYGPQLGGLANAVLRKLASEPLPWPDPDQDPAGHLASVTSHPLWIIQRWLARWGAERTRAQADWDNQRPALWLRWNRLRGDLEAAAERLSQAQVEVEADPRFPGYFRLTGAFYPAAHELVQAGDFSVQDPSASLAVRLLDPQPGTAILDLCAAPGGKTTLMAEWTGDRAGIMAVDLSRHRLKQLTAAVKRLGLMGVQTNAADGREFARHCTGGNCFDAVLLDVPCSGFGVLQRRADLRWRRRPEDLDHLVPLQKELIRAAAACVKQGGSLVYSTCSIEPEENEDIVGDFLAGNADFALDVSPRGLPAELVARPGEISTFSPRDRIDGVYAARIIRRT
ncbi:MAG: 16S rRNA (cytosine(967)-C(5))-methyltransferase [Candidatus Zixiibacteriota bacterium]|nr:MAG: 16S rRNA (cytosine(967)-C(5))-methyltransferase [candidate division Zixibacteria bacterium]